MQQYIQLALLASAAVAVQQFSVHRTEVKKQLKAEKSKKEAEKRRKDAEKADDMTPRHYVVEIEYCPGCRWNLRAAWLAQELLATFQTDLKCALRSVTLTPEPIEGGTFKIYLHDETKQQETVVLWDRRIKRAFPESKELKQIVRDYVSPTKDLGHSDKK